MSYKIIEVFNSLRTVSENKKNAFKKHYSTFGKTRYEKYIQCIKNLNKINAWIYTFSCVKHLPVYNKSLLKYEQYFYSVK